MGLGVKLILTGFGVLAVAVALIVILSYLDVRQRNDALAEIARTIETPFGMMEFAVSGDGAPVLVVHGAGGGFDQGLAIAESFGGDGFQWLAPSRFGYLGSDLPSDASTAMQADAFAALLDHLQIEHVAVLAFSGGVPPALKLAERHPERVTALAMLSSAPFTPYAGEGEDRPIPTWVYQALFGNDAVYWTLARLAPGRLASAFDARPDLRVDLAPDEARFLSGLVANFLPASRRMAGVMNEGAAIAPDAVYALEAIAAPTLIVHARDDRLNPFATASRLTAGVPNARLLALDRGGHLLLGHHADMRTELSVFLATRPPDTPIDP